MNSNQNLIRIVGIINLSPESFGSESYADITTVLAKVKEMKDDGADCIDIGAQSTKPGSIQLTLDEELKKIKGMIKAIKSEFPAIPVSIDSTRSEVVELAIKEGVDMINDISGGRFDEKVFKLVQAQNLKYVITHSQGTFEDLHNTYEYKDVISELKTYFKERISILVKQGISKNQIILDPGIGFSKSSEENIEILKNLERFQSLGLPLYIGLSRKKFIGKIINEENPFDRDIGSTVLHALCIQKGISYIRTHNVKYAKQCINICKSIF